MELLDRNEMDTSSRNILLNISLLSVALQTSFECQSPSLLRNLQRESLSRSQMDYGRLPRKQHSLGKVWLLRLIAGTQTDKPSCFPENASLMKLLERFFKSLDTAQSSNIRRVLLSENKSAHSIKMSLISSQLLASGESTNRRLSFSTKPRYVLFFA